MLKKNTLIRSFFGIAILAFFIPLFLINIHLGKTGHIITLVAFIIICEFALYEFFIAIRVKKIVAILSALIVPLTFIFPIDNYQLILESGKNLDVLDYIKLAMGGWINWAIMILFSLLPLVFSDVRSNYVKHQLILTAGMILILNMAKVMWVVSMKDIQTIIFFIGITIISDTSAYFGGMFLGKKLLGGKKLAPNISPKKTVIGFLVGLICAIAFAIPVGYFTNVWQGIGNELLASIFLGILLALIAPVGDLLFSAIKRYYGLKDYSNFIPGHGGIMDRLDSLALVLFVATIIFIF